jgi:hypothetical protein
MGKEKAVPKFDGTRPMNPKEKAEISDFLLEAQKLYKNHKNGNRFLYVCFNSLIRDLTECTGQYNNCKISKAAKEKIPDFDKIKHPRQLHAAKMGKGIVKEHVKPVSVLLAEFKHDIKTKEDAEKWLNSCEIAFITKEEDVKLTSAEKELRKGKGKDPETVFKIHKEAYKKTGLGKNLEKFVIKEK